MQRDVATLGAVGLAVRVVVIGCGVTLLATAAARPGRSRAAVPLIGAALVAAAVAVRDERSAWSRFATSSETPADLLAFADHAGSNVYWEDGLELLWFKFRRPSAWSCTQGAGLIYFRGTAMDFGRRARALASLNTDGDFSRPGTSDCPPMIDASTPGPANVEAIAKACRAWPELESVVLRTAFPGAYQAVWRPPQQSTRIDRLGAVQRLEGFYLYRCDGLRWVPPTHE